MDTKLRAELLSIGIDVSGRKALYVLDEHCPGCGIVPLFSGHTCGDNWVCEACPACGKTFVGHKDREPSRTEPRCDCSVGCPFCRQCCEWLSAGVRGQLFEWPNERSA
jgi:rRNA maturation protein Nop10